MKQNFILVSLTLVLVMLAYTLVHSPANAEAQSLSNSTALIVNTIQDIDDGACNSANCSLRDAINAANASPGADIITFSVNGTITLGSSLPAINDQVTIDGSNQHITISGNDSVQVLQVNALKTLNLNHLAIANSAGSGIQNGGGMVSVSDSTFNSNTGSGIFNSGGIDSSATLTVTGSNFIGNSSSGISSQGGFGTASSTISGSTFTDNNAILGGGIFNSFGSKLTVIDSTFSGNTGGGISNYESANVANSNFSANSGSGIASSVKLIVTNSTFTKNSDRGITGSNGTEDVTNSTFSGNMNGGIYNSGVLTVKNTLIVNTAHFGDCDNTFGTLTADSTHNLADDASCGSSFKVSQHINLGVLANNGGLTKTMALLKGSAAIDQGDDMTCAAAPVNDLDQRGVIRPQGAHCDIGAYEANAVSSCTAKPSRPMLKSPADKARLAKSNPTLKWNTATCASTYAVTVKNIATGNIVVKKAGLTAVKLKLGPLPTKMTYQWFVKACNQFGCANSAGWQFTVVH